LGFERIAGIAGGAALTLALGAGGDAGSLTATLRVPADARPGQTIHLVLEVADDGAPPLTRYQRVVVTIAG
jgi:hypothetical protein